MRTALFVGSFAIAALSLVSDSKADLINFDELATGVAVTTQYPSVTFSSNPGFDNIVLSDAGSFGSSAPNHITPGQINGDTNLDFTVPVNNLSFRGTSIDTLGQVANVDIFVNSVFAASVPLLGDGTPFTPDLFDLSAYGNVTRIAINSVSDAGGLTWDDFQFTPTPEPSSMSLLVVGALALLWRSRKKA